MAGVMPAQGTDADDPDRQPGVHAGMPREEDATNSSSRSTSGSAGNSCAGAFLRLREVEIGVEEEPIGALEGRDGLGRIVRAAEPDGVEPVELDRVADRLHERGDILVDAAAAADERHRADGHELVHGDQSGENRPVVHGDVARELGPVGDDDAGADVTVVGQVHVAHDEGAGADGGRAGRLGAAIDGAVLPDPGSLPDLDPGLLAAELEVLRLAPEDGPDADTDARAEPDVALQRDAGLDPAAVADDHRRAR